MKDGQTFRSVKNGSGTLNANDDDDEPLQVYEGQYRCYASNDLGTAMTPTVQVIVEGEYTL